MTRDTLVTVAWTTGCLALAVAAFVAGIRNVAEFRRLRRLPPLDESEIIRATPRAMRIPRRWPRPESVDDARVAAAYRDFVRELSEGFQFLGGTIGLVAGAALGVTIGRVTRVGWQGWPALVWTLVGMFGLVLRRAAEVYGTNLGNRYERRRAELSRPPAPPERRSWFRRRRR